LGEGLLPQIPWRLLLLLLALELWLGLELLGRVLELALE